MVNFVSSLWVFPISWLTSFFCGDGYMFREQFSVDNVSQVDNEKHI